MKKRKIAALYRMNASHHIDHLAPFCDLLGATFVTGDEGQEELAQKYYPTIPIEWVEPSALNAAYLQERYDLILYSFNWPKEALGQTLKKGRFLHIPHGNSDKAPGLVHYPLQDLCLLYGNHMIDMLKRQDLFSSLKDPIVMGNLRLSYYRKYQAFFDKAAEKEVFSKLNPAKKTILYAPTWGDYENSTSLYEAYASVLDHLPKEYNVIVKLHPWLTPESPWLAQASLGRVYHIIGKYEHTPDVLFLTEYPPIYPLLAKSDIYLGDFSSIGYDFLAFNRPLFFFNSLKKPENDPSLFLHQCGTTLPMNQGENILSLIKEGLEKDASFAKKRAEIYLYAFAEKDPELVRKEILRVCC